MGGKKKSCWEEVVKEAKCSREDSNLHGFPHTVLSRTRLPIPPREQTGGPYNARVPAACKVKPATIQRNETRKSPRAFLPCANLQLVRFAYLTKRAQKIGIIGYDNLVVLQR